MKQARVSNATRLLLLGLGLAAAAAAGIWILGGEPRRAEAARAELPAKVAQNAVPAEEAQGAPVVEADSAGTARSVIREEIPDDPTPYEILARVETPEGTPVAEAAIELYMADFPRPWTSITESDARGEAVFLALPGARIRAAAGCLVSAPRAARANETGPLVLVLSGRDPTRAPKSAVVRGRVLPGELDRDSLRVRVARIDLGSYADRFKEIGASSAISEYSAAKLESIDWPVGRSTSSWKRGGASALGEDHEFCCVIPLGVGWRDTHWRVEAWWSKDWNKPVGSPWSGHVPIGFSKPFQLTPGEERRVKDLSPRPPVRVRARLDLTAVDDEVARRARWSLEHDLDTRFFVSAMSYGLVEERERELEVYVPPSLAGAPTELRISLGHLRQSTGKTPLRYPTHDFGTLRMPKPGWVVGRILDHSGRSVPNHWIELRRIAEPEREAADAFLSKSRTQSKGDGSFRFGPCGPGRYQISTAERLEKPESRRLGYSAEDPTAFVQAELRLPEGETATQDLVVGSPLTRLRLIYPENFRIAFTSLTTFYPDTGRWDRTKRVDRDDPQVDVYANQRVLLWHQVARSSSQAIAWAWVDPSWTETGEVTLRRGSGTIEVPPIEDPGGDRLCAIPLSIQGVPVAGPGTGAGKGLSTLWAEQSSSRRRLALRFLPPGEYRCQLYDGEILLREWTEVVP